VKNKGFSLIELLIVVSLMGIVYGVYFFTTKQNKSDKQFKLETMKSYMIDASKKHGINLKLVYYMDKKVIYLINDKYELLDSIDFDKQITQYILKKNEVLEVAQYNTIEINEEYFEPTFIYEMTNKEIFINMILNNTKNEWLYYDSYFNEKYNKFINQEELINFIKKKDFLPMYAGKAE